jgi:hypothetical protein
MMELRIICALLIAAALATSIPVNANPYYSVNAREHRQTYRIRDGWNDSAMTRWERNDAVKDLGRIECRETRFRSDGYYSPSERARTQRSLNRESNEIWRYKNNNRIR